MEMQKESCMDGNVVFGSEVLLSDFASEVR